MSDARTTVRVELLKRCEAMMTALQFNYHVRDGCPTCGDGGLGCPTCYGSSEHERNCDLGGLIADLRRALGEESKGE